MSDAVCSSAPALRVAEATEGRLVGIFLQRADVGAASRMSDRE